MNQAASDRLQRAHAIEASLIEHAVPPDEAADLARLVVHDLETWGWQLTAPRHAPPTWKRAP